MANNLSTGEKWGIAAFVAVVIAILAYIFWPKKSTTSTGQVVDYSKMTKPQLIDLLVKRGQDKTKLEAMTQGELAVLAQTILGASSAENQRQTNTAVYDKMVASIPAYAINDNNSINKIMDDFMVVPGNRTLSREIQFDRINEQIRNKGLNYVVNEKGKTFKQAPKGTVVCCCWDETRTFIGIPFTVVKCNYAANVVNCPECASGGPSPRVGMPSSEKANNDTINGIIDSAFATFPVQDANNRGSKMTVYNQINAEIQKRGLKYVVYEKGDTSKQAPKDTVICCCWDEDRRILGITFTITKCNYASNAVNCPTCLGAPSL